MPAAPAVRANADHGRADNSRKGVGANNKHKRKGNMSSKGNHSGHARLDKQLQALAGDLDQLAGDDSTKRMRLLIRQPGWTTPAELAFALGAVAAMRSQAQSLSRQLTGLLGASQMVGE